MYPHYEQAKHTVVVHLEAQQRVGAVAQHGWFFLQRQRLRALRQRLCVQLLLRFCFVYLLLTQYNTHTKLQLCQCSNLYIFEFRSKVLRLQCQKLR